ncbi:hypothetical protein KC19_2G071300 [Ceratodon purpureus]|uniref:Secreted protein n=1 Tax=Ceratodon purpureus TaxID=3225 RepID=A0A8T0IUZ3_CERPU|nr:hypothetical protein KC19_2G071300 [Ceratodon purpureus]
MINLLLLFLLPIAPLVSRDKPYYICYNCTNRRGNAFFTFQIETECWSFTCLGYLAAVWDEFRQGIKDYWTHHSSWEVRKMLQLRKQWCRFL